MVTLLAHGIQTASRSVKYHRPRGPFCLRGHCAQCWMRIDDRPNRAACLHVACEGRRFSRQNAFPSADRDIFRGVDYLFPDGFDHHRLGATPMVPWNALATRAARRMAGLGPVSSAPAAFSGDGPRTQADLVIVGGGVSGLAAFCAARSYGLSVLLVERRRRLGGRLETGLFDGDEALTGLRVQAEAETQKGVRIWISSAACGLYRGPSGPELLVRRDAEQGEDRLVQVSFRTLLLANGAYEQAPLFVGNDLPGLFGAEALSELVFRHNILPGKRVVVVDEGPETGRLLHHKLLSMGVKSTRISSRPAGAESPGTLFGWRVVGARGGTRVVAVKIENESDGQTEEIPCDVLALALPLAPAFELAEQAGCAFAFAPKGAGYLVRTDGYGQTSVPGFLAAGSVTGTAHALASMTTGTVAGLSAVLRHEDSEAVHRVRAACLEKMAPFLLDINPSLP